MVKAENGTKVQVHYTGKLKDGTVFDSSIEREPIEFVLGAGQMIPGFDKGVLGMEVGDKKVLDIPCEDAYGPRNDQMIARVPLSALPEEIKPEVGMKLQTQGPAGQPIVVTISEIAEEDIEIDGNFELAGQDLVFEVELVGVSEAE